MSMVLVRRGTWAVCVAAWTMLVLDALPWGLDLNGGSEGIVRIIAVLAPAALWVERVDSRPADEIYEAGRAIGYEQGRRAAADALRQRLGSTADR